MKYEYKVRQVIDLVKLVQDVSGSLLYRGEDRLYPELLPKAARIFKSKLVGKYDNWDENKKNGAFLKYEKELLARFEKYASLFLTSLSDESIEVLKGQSSKALLYAQHYGLPTRMIDWTSNPLVALFFAVEQESKEDRQLLILSANQHNEYYSFPPTNKRISSGYGIVRPKQIDTRLVVQSSVLTYQVNPLQPMKEAISEEETLLNVLIPKRSVEQIRHQLNTIGINRMTLFPSVESAAIQAISECEFIFNSDE